jgi:hypothetical protein
MKVLGAFTKLPKATASFVMSICPSIRPFLWNKSVPTGPRVMIFYIEVFFLKSFEKILDSLKYGKDNGYFNMYLCTFIVPR